MDKQLKKKLIIGGIVIAVIALGVLWFWQANQPGQYDDFAKCISEKGAKFYGAFWCPHCQDQKNAFGKSAKHLPYVECSTADSNGQLEVCRKEGIEVYPTWKFADGSTEEGELSFQKLSEKTNCPINP